ncbi:MAG: cellulose synthase operon protein YhjQ/BcsQ [Anaerolineales bacterium]|nr:cellulose synthase operon protein YhjQ/BcsQ [Anaerolineales bacterium]
MPVIAVYGAKGGVGTSLVAVNLGRHLVDKAPVLLVDLVPTVGCCDLLLDVGAERPWSELLPVADELSERHLELSVVQHRSGLSLLAAPGNWEGDTDRARTLLEELAARWAWLVLDAGSGCAPLMDPALAVADLVVMVTTPDPPALRATKRLKEGAVAETMRSPWGLVLNQLSPDHPAVPERVAVSLRTQLLGVIPPDREAAAQQVHFGRFPTRADRLGFVEAMDSLTGAVVARVSGIVSEAEREIEVPDDA